MSGLASRFRAANGLLSRKLGASKIVSIFLAGAMAASGGTAFAKEQDNKLPYSDIKPHSLKMPVAGKAGAPQVVEIPSDPVEYEFFIKRTVRLLGEVNENTATRVILQLKMLDDIGNGDITLIINSPGGSVSDGRALFDAIQSLKNPVRTVCEGECASMGAFILATGAKGKRSATPNAMILIHQPSGGIGGQATDIAIQAKNIAFIKNIITELMSRYTGIVPDEVATLMERDKPMTAQRALELGIIDKIETPRQPLPPIGTRHVDVNASDFIPSPIVGPSLLP